MIIRMGIILIALYLNIQSEVYATEPAISYSREIKAGNQIDLDQGFYVCKSNVTKVGTLLYDLLDTADITERRALGRSRGCPFQINRAGERLHVIEYVAADLCLDRQLGWQDTLSGRKTITICGREGQQFIASYSGHKVTVIYISLDEDFD